MKWLPRDDRTMSMNLCWYILQLALCIECFRFFSHSGRCKSAFHRFLENLMEKVEDRLRTQEKKRRQMILPHCTWEKFGEILANNGGRIYGLFDELVSFFSTMNMYSSAKGQVQDNREYQDFLKMFTGKAKTRETSACLYS